MQNTDFVRVLYEASGVSPRDSIRWTDFGNKFWFTMSLAQMQVKQTGSMTWRALEKFTHGPYGLGVKGGSVAFFQSEFPQTTWAWDEFSFLKIDSVMGINKTISTDFFTITFPPGPNGENSALRLYATMALNIAAANFISRNHVPLFTDPISAGLVNGVESISNWIENGYPAFNPENIESFIAMAVNQLQDISNELPPIPDNLLPEN